MLILREHPWAHVLAFGFFVFAALTDYWDGLWARSLHQESSFGKIIDPTMDKLLILAPLASFSLLGFYSGWWIVPIFVREILVTFCRIGWLLEGKVLGAEQLGKLKFGLQVTAVGFAFLHFLTLDFPLLSSLSGGFKMMMLLLLFAAVLFTLVSGVSFLVRHRENFKSQAFARYTSALGVGLLPGVPGTWGSLAGLALLLLTHFNLWLYLATFLALAVAGLGAVSRLDLPQKEDPLYVVVDEACGIFVTFFAIPLSPSSLLIGFLLFRLFDVIKPYPLRRLEKLPGYWGILGDDLGAGVYAWLILAFLFL